MNYLGLVDRDPVRSGSWVFRSSDLVSHRSEFRMPNVPGFFKLCETIKCLRMCENCNFPTVAKYIYSSMTAISQPLTGRNWTGRESSAD